MGDLSLFAHLCICLISYLYQYRLIDIILFFLILFLFYYFIIILYYNLLFFVIV